MVDRFHWCNHAACSAAYNVSHVNSEPAEQVNTALQYIWPNIAVMTTRSAVMVLRFFLHVRNTQKLEKLSIAAGVAPHPRWWWRDIACYVAYREGKPAAVIEGT